MAWEVEYTDQFGEWFEGLSEEHQTAVMAHADALEALGPSLGYPRSSDVKGSRHGRMRELRIQAEGRPLRVFYAFDPRRTAILLIGGDKTGDDRFYEAFIPIADRLYDEHLQELKKRDCDMAHKIERLREKLTPTQRARAEIIAQQIIAERPLFELRRARRLSQATLADAMGLPQPNISRIENQTDTYLSTLRSYIEAMNGKLRIVAEFPDGSYEIENLHDLGDVDAKIELLT